MQSDVAEHTELSWIFTTLTPLGDLERQTQFKDKSSKLESIPAGMLMYPVLQSADILLYRADSVPVGEDQVQHLELARDTARKWNARFGEGYFPEPKPLLTPTRRIMGLDGQAKMSKSLGNTVGLLESDDEIWAKLRPAMTDPRACARRIRGVRRSATSSSCTRRSAAPTTQANVVQQCTTAGWGCMDCKKVLHANMVAELTPIRRAGGGAGGAEPCSACSMRWPTGRTRQRGICPGDDARGARSAWVSTRSRRPEGLKAGLPGP